MQIGEKRKEKSINKALDLVKKGKSYREAARLCRIDRSTVTRWAKRENVNSTFAKPPEWTPTTTDDVKPLSLLQRIKKLLGI